MASALAQLAAFLLGLLTGAILLIALALVPYWRSLEPLEMARWFATNSPLLARLMVPLGALATIATVLAAVVGRAARRSGWTWTAAAALLAVLVAAVYPLYFTTANVVLASSDVGPERIAAELARWRVWHAARLLLGALAFACALQGIAVGARTPPG